MEERPGLAAAARTIPEALLRGQGKKQAQSDGLEKKGQEEDSMRHCYTPLRACQGRQETPRHDRKLEWYFLFYVRPLA